MSAPIKTKILEERGIVLKFANDYASPEKSKPYYNAKMAICRELVLCSLGVFCKQKSAEKLTPVFCLDAFAATGICGLIWKKELRELVHVTLVDREPECIESIKENCLANGLSCSEMQLDFTRIPGLPLAKQEDSEVFVKQADTAVVMLMEGFDFIHLDPFGCTVKFMTSAFTNLRNDGIICITSTDLASLYAIHGNVTQRNYAAHIGKTDFLKEMAVRVVIATAVRNAAVCNKGLDILFTVCQEHFVLVVARIRRGPTHADVCIRQIHELLCCQICNERVFYPDAHTPVESPYELLPCDCQKQMPGKTAVEMGPMWSGSIFDVGFITSAVSVARDLQLSARCCNILNSLFSETQMISIAEPPKLISTKDENNDTTIPHDVSCDDKTALCQHRTESADHKMKSCDFRTESCDQKLVPCDQKLLPCDHKLVPCDHKLVPCDQKLVPCDQKLVPWDQKLVPCDQKFVPCDQKLVPCDHKLVSCDHKTASSDIKMDYKDKSAEVYEERASKKQKLVESSEECKDGGENKQCAREVVSVNPAAVCVHPCIPAFYYNIQKRRVRGIDMPKVSEVVCALRSAGFHASKTLFCSQSVRTNATLKQIHSVITNKYAKNKTH